MRNMALEWAVDHGIRANAIAPGPVSSTPGMDKLLPAEMTSGGADHDALLAQNIPTGRNIHACDIAMAAVYLASSAGGCHGVGDAWLALWGLATDH